MKNVITIREVEQAAHQGITIPVDAHTIITPYAVDRAKELGVHFVKKEEIASNEKKLPDDDTVDVVVVGADHGGFALKEELIPFIRTLGVTVIDAGTHSAQACDYPDFAFKVAETVAQGQAQRGIMIDSVGIGSAMAANRVPGILAAKCNNPVEAASAREHNYANVLTLGAKIIGSTMAKEIVRIFLQTKGGAERHRRRINKILNWNQKS